MEIRKETFFAVPGSHKPGELARIIGECKKGNVNLKGLWGHGSEGGNAEIFCVPEDASNFKQCFGNVELKEGTCLFVSGNDNPGSLCDVFDKISGQGVNLRASDAIKVGNQFGCFLWCDESDQDKLCSALGV